ncbi:unnamed protein product [Rotaria sp. Silwood1]|nr:unnamed protein product [Rotaria sp. Silwood1]
MSFDFHPDTDKQLFNIIQQLSAISTQDLKDINFSEFNISNDDLQKWYDIVLKLACQDNEKLKRNNL